MNDLSFDGKALVDAARNEAGLAPEERARLRARVLATAGAAGTSVAGSLFAKLAAAKALVSSGAVWGVVIATVTVVAGVYTVTRVSPTRAGKVLFASPRPNSAPLPNASSTETAAAAPSPPSGSLSRDDELRVGRSRSVKAKVRAAPSASSEAGFAEDARLLREVRVALAAGEGDRALSLLEARESNKASGVFAEEREAAKIVTLCALGRQEAHAAATRFLTTHGTSPLAERVRRACSK
jgi:hypothetical protein